MPPEALTFALPPDVVPREEVAEDAPVGQPPDAIPVWRRLGDLESSYPGPLIPVAHVDLGPGCKRRPRIQIEYLPPAVAHDPHRIEDHRRGPTPRRSRP